jgi:hypothetical protein
MSYGVWRKRGKGWASIEIDSPWNYTFYDLEQWNPNSYKALKSKTGEDGLSNPHYCQWEHTQNKHCRQIVDLPTGGEHTLTVAFDDDEAYARALIVLEGSYWKEECVKRGVKGFRKLEKVS